MTRRLVKCAVAAYLLRALNGGAKGYIVCVSARRVVGASPFPLQERGVARFLSYYFLRGPGAKYVVFFRRRKTTVCIKRGRARAVISKLGKRCGRLLLIHLAEATTKE